MTMNTTTQRPSVPAGVSHKGITSKLYIGVSSSFEPWLQRQPFAFCSDAKHAARDAFAAGIGRDRTSHDQAPAHALNARAFDGVGSLARQKELL